MDRSAPAAGPRPKRRKEAGASGARRARRASKSAPQAAPIKVSSRRLSEERETRGPRRALVSGSALLLLGLGMVGVDSSDVGAGVTLIGLLIMIFGIHSFGRLGPDEPAIPDRADD